MPRIPAVALVSLVFCALAQASDLSLDGGRVSVDKLMASDMTIAVNGTPGARVSVYLDLDPGPILVDGIRVPIGFSPAWTSLPLGTVGPDGLLEARIKLPVDPAFHEMTVYAAAIGFLANGSYEVSNGVDITLRDRNVQLAGRALAGYPSFEYVRAAQVGDTIEVAVETSRFPELVDRPGDVYVVASRTRAEWIADPGLSDIVGGPVAIDLVAGSLSDNTIVVDVGTLSGDAGTDIGVGYDVILDMNRDGRFNGDDLIDGYEDESGFYVVSDLTQPGPLDVTEILYTGGVWLGQNTYYPTDIDSMGTLPLVVVSHGNGHNYQWYDHIGEHLASYGYVVMSHQNQTGPGIGSASTTTLTNTDYFLGNLDAIGGGVLDGHIDSSRMTWIGHSRGGEGILRAYDRIVDGVYTPTHFGADDVQLLSSIAPTAFLSILQADPHDATFSLWTGGADSDVNGCPSSDITQTFQLHDRAEQERISISLHGAGHGDFHDGGGSNFANGPCKIGRVRTHVIMRSYLLPLVKHVIDGNLPAKDYLWRQWEGFARLGGPSDTACVVVDLQYREGPEVGSFVIDDYQLNDDDLGQSSSGGVVTAVNLTDHIEGRPNDNNPTFTLNANDPWNGFTYARNNGDMRHSIVEYMGDASLEFAILPGDADFTDHAYLSFRSCQATRNPLTIAELGDTTFDVTFTDSAGVSSTINVGAYGGGIEEPYQRTGCGVGAGWANEYETIRMRLTDFLHDGSGLDLSSIASLRFDFGPSHGSPGGRLGLDDIQLTVD